MMNRRERKKQQTKDAVLECAVALFHQKGFTETTMEEVAEKADVSKGTLYNYFEDKESILAEYVQSRINENGKKMIEHYKEDISVNEMLSQVIEFMNRIIQVNLKLSEVYIKYRCQTFFSHHPFANSERSGLENVILEVITQAQRKGELRNDISPVIMARSFMLLYMNYFISTRYEEGYGEISQYKNQIISLFLSGTKND